MKKLIALFLALITLTSTLTITTYAAEINPYLGYYIPVKVSFGDGKITVTQTYYEEGFLPPESSSTIVTEITGGAELVDFVNHIVFGEPDTTPEDFNSILKKDPDEKYGSIYMYDYFCLPVNESDREQNADLLDFAEFVTDLKETPSKYIDQLDGDDVNDLAKAWRDAYNTAYSENYEVDFRYDIYTQYRYNKEDICDILDDDGYLLPHVYDLNDVFDYNVVSLLYDIYNSTGAEPTSYLLYLNKEFERVMPNIAYEAHPELNEEYYQKLDKITGYPESDYSETAWETVQQLIADAKDAKSSAEHSIDLQNAIDLLDEALAVRGKPVDYTAIQNALIKLFVPADPSDPKASDIKPDLGIYLGNGADKYVYNVNDFTVNGVTLEEWLKFAGDENGKYNDENATFTEAYRLYRKVRGSLTSVKQSELDKALDKLNESVLALKKLVVYEILGNVKAYGDISKYINIELLNDGDVIDTITVVGTNGAYSFKEVKEGTYTLRFSKTKHATCEYKVTVDTADVTQDAEIWIYGDLNSDGIANNADVLQINRMNANKPSVFDLEENKDYRRKVANVTAAVGTDTIINNADALHINRMNANKNSVFDGIA